MTDTHTTPPGVRVLPDGGIEPKTVVKARTASDVVTREIDGEEQDMLRVPISSTRVDREDDRFDKDALEAMAEGIRAKQPMVFDNHGLAGNWMEAIPYDSRETIGAQMDAELESADDGEWDLYALVNPDGTHPEGERMVRQIREEAQPIKFSVGFKIFGYEARAEVEEEYEGDGRVFTSVDLMETSRVGIPANPDASVSQSLSAKGGAGAEGLPGFQNHPMVQMMQAMQDGEMPEGMAAKDAVDAETVQDATPTHVDGQGNGKAATDGGTPEDETELRGIVRDLTDEVSELRDEVADLRDPEKVEGGCDVDTDCPEGEVCLEGECVPEEDVDDDDEDESASATPEKVQELREQNRELKAEVSEVREMLTDDDAGDAATGDTTLEANTPEAEADDTDADESDDETKDAGLLFD